MENMNLSHKIRDFVQLANRRMSNQVFDETFICLISLITIKLTLELIPGCIGNDFTLYFIHFKKYLLLLVTISYYGLLSVAMGKIARAARLAGSAVLSCR